MKNQRRHRNLLFLFIVLCMFVGCRPRGVLSAGQMRDVLIDLHKTDALLQVCGLQHGHDEAEDIYYAMVLDRHGISQAQFDSSLVWYTAHPKRFDKIYPKVMTQLTIERETLANQLSLSSTAVKGRDTQSLPLTEQECQQRVDSILWVTQHGYPTLWNPYKKISVIPYK